VCTRAHPRVSARPRAGAAPQRVRRCAASRRADESSQCQHTVYRAPARLDLRRPRALGADAEPNIGAQKQVQSRERGPQQGQQRQTYKRARARRASGGARASAKPSPAGALKSVCSICSQRFARVPSDRPRSREPACPQMRARLPRDAPLVCRASIPWARPPSGGAPAARCCGRRAASSALTLWQARAPQLAARMQPPCHTPTAARPPTPALAPRSRPRWLPQARARPQQARPPLPF